MRITSRGQVTIPVEIRKRLGLLPGTEVQLEIRDDALWITPTRQSSGDKLVAQMRGRATSGLSTDEIMALTRPAILLTQEEESPE